MQGSSTRSRIRHTSQGDAAAANAAGVILMVDQGGIKRLHLIHKCVNVMSYKSEP